MQETFASPATPVIVLSVAARHLVPSRPELAVFLLANPSLPQEMRELIHPSLEASKPAGTPPAAASSEEAYPIVQRETLLQKIRRMSVPEKINAALTGNQEERAILVRDANKIVARTVLQSPKLCDQEIESIAMMKNVNEEILRLVAANRKFIRSYAVVRNLANNPRAPLDVALPFVNRLNDRDLKELSRNKNVTETLRSAALKLVRQKEASKKP